MHLHGLHHHSVVLKNIWQPVILKDRTIEKLNVLAGNKNVDPTRQIVTTASPCIDTGRLRSETGLAQVKIGA